MVLDIWKETGYGSEGPMSRWIKSIDEERCTEICAGTVNDALAYLRLVAQWHKYVEVIEGLKPANAYWLFRRFE